MESNKSYILIVCLGVSSWVTVNGIFSILPLIIGHVPEGWSIASTLSLAVQAANIGPLLYRVSRKNLEILPVVVYGILAVGVLSMVLLACFWHVTMHIFGKPCSIALVAFTFTAALCDCTSSVVFWPFAGMLGPMMVSGLAFGESLSGVVASAVSWLGLSPSLSFCVLALVLVIAGAAFHKLQDQETALASESLITEKSLNPTLPYLVVGIMSLFENAVLPSVLPYATAKHSQMVYHIAATLPIGPVALFTLVYFQASRVTVAAMAVGAVFGVGLVVWAGLGCEDCGGAFTVSLVLLAKMLVVYSKGASMYHLKAGVASSSEAQMQLETAGGMMQVWSLIGAVIMYVLIHYTALFPEHR